MTPSLIHLPPDSVQVVDADEEIFVIYAEAAAARLSTSGLGSLDSCKDEIILELELRPRNLATSPPRDESSAKRIEIALAQDVTGLRSRAGDTGSVIWRASVEFAKAVLTDSLFPIHSLVFDRERLRNADVLELGAGTGVLGVLLAPHVGRYLATDLPELLPLIRKNIEHNFPHSEPAHTTTKASGHGHGHRRPKTRRLQSGVSDSSSGTSRDTILETQPLDWLALEATQPGSKARARARAHVAFGANSSHTISTSSLTALHGEDPHFDLILAVDTLYNPALVPSFLAAIEEFSTAEQDLNDGAKLPPTFVIVVCELRDEDVLRDFLDGWLKLGQWEIWRLDGGSSESESTDQAEGNGTRFIDGPFVAWVGWKTNGMATSS